MISSPNASIPLLVLSMALYTIGVTDTFREIKRQRVALVSLAEVGEKAGTNRKLARDRGVPLAEGLPFRAAL